MLLQVVTVLVLLLLTRLRLLFSESRPQRRKDGETCTLAIFLGSGGHTGEALMLASALNFSRYSPRIYIISEGDTLSATKAISLEHAKVADDTPTPPSSDGQEDYRIFTIPRARRVHQSLLTVLPTFMRSILACIHLVTISPFLKRDTFGAPFADLLIMNGPGTCVTLCVAVMINKLLGIPHPRMVYIESYARVRSLSLSGRILRFFVDRFIVQWPSLVSTDSREECYGCLKF